MPTMHGALIGSYERVASLLDDYATVPAVRGVMLTFDDFVAGMDKFGQHIQPLMASRRHILESAAAQ
jgi:pyrimidine oxygenase